MNPSELGQNAAGGEKGLPKRYRKNLHSLAGFAEGIRSRLPCLQRQHGPLR